MSDCEKDLSDRSDHSISKMANAESDSGYSLTEESSPAHQNWRNLESVEPSDSEAGPDIADEVFRPADEIFKDPNAFVFLSQHGVSTSGVSQLARDSLYYKFDPLIAGRLSIPPNETMDLITFSPPIKNASKKKKNSSVITLNADNTYRTNNNDIEKKEENWPQLSKDEEIMWKQRLEDECQNYIKNMETKETQIEELDKVIKMLREDCDGLKKEVRLRQGSEEQMKQVFSEYEKTISELISEKEKDKVEFEEERMRLMAERDQALEDESNVEFAFGELFNKYLRCKQIVEDFKKNEETLKRSIEEYNVRLQKQEDKYERLKIHAEETLEKANKEIENITRSQDNEVTRLTAILKKTEAKALTLERLVDQKVKENEELTAICDELIAKVGTC